MGGFGEGAADAADKKAGDTGVANEQKIEGENNKGNGEHNHSAGEQGAAASPFKLVNETLVAGNKLVHQKVEELSSAASKLILDKLPLVLDAPVLIKPKEKSYSMIVDLDGEVARRLANAPESIQEFYKDTREAQLEHEPTGLDAVAVLNGKDAADYRDQWAQMNAWLAFPENDADCQEGRKLYIEYLKHELARDSKGPLNEEEQKKALAEDNPQLAKLYSLWLNDHDYLHNEDEITQRNGMHHLPKDFTWTVTENGQSTEKHFNVQEIAQRHMLAILNSSDEKPTYKSPLNNNERAVHAFFTQNFRQIFPAKLLDDAHKAEREEILNDFANQYKNRDYDLSQAGLGIWQQGMEMAANQYPEMAKIKPGLQLTDAEWMEEHFTLVNTRQLAVEAHEMRELVGHLGKPSELAYPDLIHLSQFNTIKGPARPYREGQVAEAKQFTLHSPFQAKASKYIELTPKEELRLKNWKGTPNDWQTVYWNDNPNTRENKIQKEIISRFPLAQQCSISQKGADLLRKWKSGAFIPGNESNRLTELLGSLRDPAIKEPCFHDAFPRKKGKLN